MNQKKSALFLLSLFIVFGLSSCFGPKKAASPAVKPLFVKFEPAQLGKISQFFETAGELKAYKEINVAAERAGKVAKVFVSEGQYVNIGDKLIQIQGEDVAADLSKAKQDFESYKKLFDEGAISRLELLQYETAVKRFESQKDNLLITAISAGRVGTIYIDPGDFLNLGSLIMDLLNLYPLRVSFNIPEKLIGKLKLGQSLVVTTSAYPEKEFLAKVSFIAPNVDKTTRTILVRATVPDPERLLRANQFVKVKQEIKNLKDAVLVREEAIYLEQGQEYIYLAEDLSQEEKDKLPPSRPNGPPPPAYKAKRVPIKTGLREPGIVQIVKGIKEGDQVIYAGLTSIYPGAKLIKVEEKS